MKLNFKKLTRREVVYIILSTLISVSFLLLAFYLYKFNYIRLWGATKDLGSSLKFYFLDLFDVPCNVPSVANVDYSMVGFLPIDFGGFKLKLENFFLTFFDWKNFATFFGFSIYSLKAIFTVLLFLIVICMCIPLLLENYVTDANTKHDKDTKVLAGWRKFSTKVTVPCVREIKAYFAWVAKLKPLWIAWIVLWVCSVNFGSIIMEFFAFYFYFAGELDLLSIYPQVFRLSVDLILSYNSLPLFMWLILSWLLFDFIRRRIGKKILRRNELRNRGYINSLPLSVMLNGSMGTGKTMHVTDMAISQEIMFRDKALEIMLKSDMKFPYFPWINFDLALKEQIKEHKIYNLATCLVWIDSLAKKFEAEQSKNNLFGYDFEKYGLTYDNHLHVQHIFDVLSEYARCYFIFVIKSSLLYANYSIRVDNLLIDKGNLPLWNLDIFERKSVDEIANSHFSHILDFDMLRLGKRLVKNGEYANAFDFGCIAVTEIGKERGNTIENKDIKGTATEANQKNDMFNRCLKMIRHNANIDHFSFVRLFCDEQRPESLGADVRDLCYILDIQTVSDSNLAMPWFFIEELLYDFVFSRFISYYTKYRHNRGDNTFFMYVWKTIVAAFNHYYTRIYGDFGYEESIIFTQRGTMNGNITKSRYYLASKKIKSNRYSTDCFSDYFFAKNISSDTGIEDVPCYGDSKATFTELISQNSYFINDLVSEHPDWVNRVEDNTNE